MASDLTAYLRVLRRGGYDVAMTGHNHWKICRDGRFVATCGGTRGSWWALTNLKSAVRRYERHWAAA